MFINSRNTYISMLEESPSQLYATLYSQEFISSQLSAMQR
jgi:hypothetical protein